MQSANRTFSIAERANELMRAYSESASPQSYEIWFTYVSGLKPFLNEAVVPYEADEVTRLVVDTHDVGGAQLAGAGVALGEGVALVVLALAAGEGELGRAMEDSSDGHAQRTATRDTELRGGCCFSMAICNTRVSLGVGSLRDFRRSAR